MCGIIGEFIWSGRVDLARLEGSRREQPHPVQELMRDLRIGSLGLIVSGREEGRWVEVVDDHNESGGYLILTFADAHRSPDAFDAWVESILDVELYFDECGWDIRWLD